MPAHHLPRAIERPTACILLCSWYCMCRAYFRSTLLAPASPIIKQIIIIIFVRLLDYLCHLPLPKPAICSLLGSFHLQPGSRRRGRVSYTQLDTHQATMGGCCSSSPSKNEELQFQRKAARRAAAAARAARDPEQPPGIASATAASARPGTPAPATQVPTHGNAKGAATNSAPLQGGRVRVKRRVRKGRRRPKNAGSAQGKDDDGSTSGISSSMTSCSSDGRPVGAADADGFDGVAAFSPDQARLPSLSPDPRTRQSPSPRVVGGPAINLSCSSSSSPVGAVRSQRRRAVGSSLSSSSSASCPLPAQSASTVARSSGVFGPAYTVSPAAMGFEVEALGRELGVQFVPIEDLHPLLVTR